MKYPTDTSELFKDEVTGWTVANLNHLHYVLSLHRKGLDDLLRALENGLQEDK